MKQKTKKIIENSLFGVLSFVMFAGFNAFAAPGDTVNPILHKGGGDQPIASVRIGSDTFFGGPNYSPTGARLEAIEPNKISVFDGVTDADSRVVALSSAWHMDKVFVGKLTTQLAYSSLVSSNLPISSGVYSADSPANTLWLSSTYSGTFTPILRSLNVLGGISNSSFAAPAATTQNICVDAAGNFLAC